MSSVVPSVVVVAVEGYGVHAPHFAGITVYATQVTTTALHAAKRKEQAAATTVRNRTTIPFDVVVDNPCTGEPVALSGAQQLIFHLVFDARGGVHAHFSLVPQQVRGVGLYSGTAYHAVGGGGNNFTAAADDAPLVTSTRSTANVVSQGGSDNLVMHSTTHLTINATGEVTAVVNNVRLTCTG